MQKLSLKSLDNTIEIWSVTNHELYDVLQRIRTLGLRVKPRLAAFSLLEDRHLKDDVTTQLGRFELKAVG